MNTIRVITNLTLREAFRRKIVLASLLLGIAFLVVYGLGFYFIHEEFQREFAEEGSRVARFQNEGYNFLFLAGMYVVNFLMIASAALITADSLAGEIQSGTIQAIVTKPIRRSQVVMGKWLGYAVLLLMYMLLIGGGILLIVLAMVKYQPPNWLLGIGLIYLNSLLIMTLTLAFSSSFSTLATGGAVFGVFGVAFIGGWVERIGAFVRNQTAIDLGIVSSLLLPSEALWNKASSLMTAPLSALVGTTPFTSTSQPSTIMMVYAGFYLVAMVGVAVWRFSKRDL